MNSFNLFSFFYRRQTHRCVRKTWLMAISSHIYFSSLKFPSSTLTSLTEKLMSLQFSFHALVFFSKTCCQNLAHFQKKLVYWSRKCSESGSKGVWVSFCTEVIMSKQRTLFFFVFLFHLNYLSSLPAAVTGNFCSWKDEEGKKEKRKESKGPRRHI